MRAGTYIAGGPKPPFTPGYELVGVVEELGPGCAKLRVGDRIGALTVWGADAETVCVPEAGTVEVPEDLDPAEVVSLLFPYMTSYQALHRTARAQPGESVLVHGAAGRVGVAALECGAQAGLHLYGTCSGRDFAAVEKLGAVPIDYRNEDFVARIRELTGGKGVDVVLDSLGGPIRPRSRGRLQSALDTGSMSRPSGLHPVRRVRRSSTAPTVAAPPTSQGWALTHSTPRSTRRSRSASPVRGGGLATPVQSKVRNRLRKPCQMQPSRLCT